jgi:hypothetical protein
MLCRLSHVLPQPLFLSRRHLGSSHASRRQKLLGAGLDAETQKPLFAHRRHTWHICNCICLKKLVSSTTGPLLFILFQFNLFRVVGWEWVHLVHWPLIGLLYQPLMRNEYRQFGRMRIGSGNRSTRRKRATVHFVYHKSHMTWPRIEPGPSRCEALELRRFLL